MRAIYIRVPTHVLEMITELATRERRDPRVQAELLLERAANEERRRIEMAEAPQPLAAA